MSFFRHSSKPRVNAEKKEGTSSSSFFATKEKRGRVIPTSVTRTVVEETMINQNHDLRTMDRDVTRRIVDKFSKLPDMKKDLEDLENIAREIPRMEDSSHIEKSIRSLRQNIRNIEAGFEYATYLWRTSPIIDEYMKLLEKTPVSSFCVKVKTDPSIIERKEDLLREYLSIASEYVKIDTSTHKKTVKFCPECMSEGFFADKQDATSIICDKCGLLVQLFDNTPSYRDGDRTNTAPRYKYSPRHHFGAAMDRYECLADPKITEEQISDLRAKLAPHIDTGTLKMRDLYTYLSMYGYKEHYDEARYIYYRLTGKKGERITEYRQELFDMFDQLTEVYDEIQRPGIDGPNSQNVNFKLFYLLRLLDFECPREEWNFLKTPAKEQEHREKMAKQIDILMEKYPDAMTSRGKPRWRHLDLS